MKKPPINGIPQPTSSDALAEQAIRRAGVPAPPVPTELLFIPAAVAQAILDYLITRPFAEVWKHVQALTNLQRVEAPPSQPRTDTLAEAPSA